MNTVNNILLPFAVLSGCAHLAMAQTDYVEVYEQPHYQGRGLRIHVDAGVSDLSDYQRGYFGDWNNVISSVKVYGAVLVRLYEDANYLGRHIDLTESVSDLRYYTTEDWNNRASSLKVFKYPDLGWFYDDTLRSDVFYWIGGFCYHKNGLGWLWAGFYDRLEQEGWLYDHELGFLYTEAGFYPWFFSYNGYDGNFYYYLESSSSPRYFFNFKMMDWIFSYPL